jgi:hypothetical protein
VEGFFAPAQNARIARTQAECGGISCYVGARFENHGNDAKWNTHSLNHEAIGARLLGHHLSHEVWHFGNRCNGLREADNPGFIEHQTVQERSGKLGIPSGCHVGSIGCEDLLAMSGQRFGDAPEPLAALRRSGARKSATGAGRLLAEARDLLVYRARE